MEKARKKRNAVVEEENDAKEKPDRVVVGLFDGELDIQTVLRKRKHCALQSVHIDLRLL